MSSVQLSEVCEIVMGQAPDGASYNGDGNGLPLISGAGDFAGGKVRAKKFTTSPGKICQPGDIILGIRASIGERAWADAVYCLGRGVAGLRPYADHLDSGYLWHLLDARVAELADKGRGSTFKQISRDDLAELSFPKPSLPEQKRITAILDKADAIREKRRAALAEADALLRATFLDLFGDPVANPKGWEETRLDLVADIRSGITKGRKSNGEPLRAVPYMRVANVQDGHIDLSNIKTIDASETEIARYGLRPGDILLTEGGDPDKLGRGAVWFGEISECIHQNHIFVARLNETGISPEYASALLSSARGKQYFLRSAKQTTGIASINRTQLAAFPVLLPDRAVHDRWLRMNRAAVSAKDELARLSTEAATLYASLAQRAFRGEL
ncbi:restriction endonuclease subunit S [Sphingomonas sp. GCM10030256]|uniref:restriction endonuclease subunit S n=1 Tax=Sphingomonas sp. GCM10030256 TaxID=3273427 RepID=UPI003617FE0F